MIIVFIVVLVVFGPQKLPELARGLGKLMAEFRKASTDFRSAFEQEMRDIERQALEAERKKAAEAAVTAAAPPQLAAANSPASMQAGSAALDVDARAAEGPVITPVAESVARSDGSAETAQPAAEASAPSESSRDPSHDQQQPV